MATLLEKEYATHKLFNLEHNLTEYNRLVGENGAYHDKISMGAAALDGYAKPSEKFNRPSESFNKLEEYSAPFQSANETFLTQKPVFEKYAAPKTAFDSSPCIPVQLESYARPVFGTFRPKIVENELTYNDFGTAAPTAKQPELVAEVNFDVLRDEHKYAHRETDIDAGIDTQNFTRLKLSPVGMVAVISFLAVAVMIIAFVIANSIAIGTNSAKIENLSAQNSTLSGQIVAQNAANASFLEHYGSYYLADKGMTVEQYIAANGYTTENITASAIPAGEAWTAQGNPDASSNLFDWFSKMLSKIF
jgi:hypothetical protein